MSRRIGRFDEKIALVTGGGGGLGKSQARMFAEEGATVLVADLSSQRGEAVVKAINDCGGRAHFFELDVACADSWMALYEQVRDRFGALHVLVNNAGVISRETITTVGIGEWQKVLNVNLTGPMLGIQTMGPLIRDSGGGSIVNISSTAGIVGHPGVAYAASKWGLRGLTKSAALGLVEWGIRVNSVHPAQVSDTYITSNAPPGWQKANELTLPTGRLANTDEVAHAVLFLASDEASYINASEIVLDGGAASIGGARVRAMLAKKFNESSLQNDQNI